MSLHYLIKRNEIYYFNYWISHEQKFVRKSLKTDSRREANEICYEIMSKIRGTRLSKEVIKQLIEVEIDRAINKATEKNPSNIKHM